MPSTAHGLRTPALSDNSNGPLAFQNLADDVEANFTAKFTPATIYAYRTTSNQAAGSHAEDPFTVTLNGTNGTPQNMSLNTSTGVITVGSGAGGEYTVAGKIDIAVGAAARVFATVYVNGSERLRGMDNINRGAIAGDVVGSNLAGPLTLAAGDQVTLRYLHTGPTGAGVVLPTGVFINWLQLRRIS